MEVLTIREAEKQLDARDFSLENSKFVMGSLRNSRFEDLCLESVTFFDINGSKMKIVNANLSDLEIEGAQLGGAYIHNIGMPPKDHPMYVEGARMRPVKFDDCDLSQSTIRNCNLSGVEISDCNLSGVTLKDCNLTGMTINGIPVEQLLTSFNARG
jgi:uncharacterized protein YjbI with pentapeptide repeats